MNKKPILLFLLLTLSLLLCVPSAAAQQRSRANPRPVYDQKPFDVSRDDLPPEYLGHSFPAVYVAAARRQIAVRKGEYETTADFRTRLAQLNNASLVGTIRSDSLLAFVAGPVRQEYDADQKALHLSLALPSHDGGAYLIGTWSRTEKLIGSYVGRNAFNRAVRVKAYRYDEYLLKIDRKLALQMSSFNGATDAFTGSVVAAPLDAQKLKPHIRALLDCQLGEGGVSLDKDHDDPTIDEPYDEYTFRYTMNVFPRAVWFFDSSSGLILSKIDLANRKPNQAATELTPQRSVTNQIGNNLESRCRILEKPEPQYTEEARRKQITGTVVLMVVLTETGRVGDIVVKQGLPDGLTERAIDAAKRIRFVPAEKNGKSVPCQMQLEYNFNTY